MADHYDYDLIIIGAGSGGLVAARFASQLGAHVALIERNRIGGDCTWTGCVPSKSLIRVARAAHSVRASGRFGVRATQPEVDMRAVRDYLRSAIAQVYKQEDEETLRAEGIDVVHGAARFLDQHTISVGDHNITGKAFLLCTGAQPDIPDLPGLSDVPYVTSEQIFDNDRLPQHLIVVGGGPIGMELAQAYARLGAKVTVISGQILPEEEPEVAQLMEDILAREGVSCVKGEAQRFHKEGSDASDVVVTVDGGQEVRGDMLLLATGRSPVVDGLDLEKAGVSYSHKGIEVNEHLQTSAKHIYAAGDCTGGYQFTHFAGWQAFQAVRNALLPGSSQGFSDVVPWVTFTDPEIAHVGKREAEARQQFGDSVQVISRNLDEVDRAICEDATNGLIKIIHKKDGTILGATIVAARAGEAITELAVAMQNNLKLSDLAATIHAYPTYSTPIQQMAADVTVANLLGSVAGKVIRGLSGLSDKG